MSNEKHTPGPWHASGGSLDVLDARGMAVVDCASGTCGMDYPEACANQRRIVACVNACEGLDTAMLERHPLNNLAACLNGGIASTLDAIELQRQRVALLTALDNTRSFVAAILDMQPDAAIDALTNNGESIEAEARAAIDSVKGGA